MSHQHHHHSDTQSGDRQVLVAVVINVGLTVAQIIGGILSGSLALIADAIHNLSDAISLIIAFAARRIARRPSDHQMTFGYVRAEIVAALINYTTLIVIGLYLVYEAIFRFIEPTEVDGWLTVIIAGVALAIDLATAALTWRLSKESINIRAAFLHNLADALGSVAVIVAGTLILLYDWRLADPIATIAIAGFILWHAFAEIGTAIRILMLGAPPETDGTGLIGALCKIDGVVDVHHIHLWQMDERRNSLEAHLVISEADWVKAEELRKHAETMLRDDFGVAHTTLQIEHVDNRCDDNRAFGQCKPADAADGRAA
ncbi:MAG TPA: cation diffusion facilitator family transporter [Afifellaceae bacterium]|nr:cation diffusion facilitator family transporter [Afifellaceae bacterium]